MTDSHTTPGEPLDEEQFAAMLDAMTLGQPVPESGLAATAAAVQDVGGEASAPAQPTASPLDRATKSRIWSSLMRELDGAPTAATAPPAAGAAGSALVLNPWEAGHRREKRKRSRPSPGVLRFIPAPQPTGTFLLVVVVLALVGASFALLAPNGGNGIFPAALATEDSSHAGLASPEASPSATVHPVSCTIWRSPTPPSFAGPDSCTLSDAWWTAWSSCAITPVRTELWSGAPEDSLLRRLPWVVAESAEAEIIGHQFYGNRPLPVNGEFVTEGMIAKTLWTFDRPVQNLTIAASNMDAPSLAAVEIPSGPANSASGFSTDWPSNLALPSAGCWQVSLTAEDKAGVAIHGTVVYIVVD